MSNTPSINLVRTAREGFLDKFIHWALSIGRVVIILTEGIALSAFLYRFYLDRRLIDLRDEIHQKQTIVKYSEKNEQTYRNFQDRLLLAAKLQKASEHTVLTFNDILEIKPEDFALTTFTLTDTRVVMEGFATSIETISSFVNALKNYPTVTAVSLDKVESKTSSAAIAVIVSATFKKQTIVALQQLK